MIRLPNDSWNLIGYLRKEAADLKACFRGFFDTTLRFVTAAIAMIVALQHHWEPLIGLASIAVAIVPLVVVRLGAHKYGAANRYHGYELHLERIYNLPKCARTPLDTRIVTIGWEEAMRAWRIVQPTLYEEIYTHARQFPHRVKPNYRREPSYKWFDPPHTVANIWDDDGRQAVYHAGTHLKTMMSVLHLLAALALLPAVWALFELYYSADVYAVVGGVATFSLVLCFMVRSILRSDARRVSMESGILSIHACAVVWHAVAVAHLRALDLMQEKRTMKGYIAELATQALSLSQKPLKLHEWILEATFANGRWDEETLRRRVENPDDLHAYFDLGALLAARGQHHEAIEKLLFVVKREPDFADEAARKLIEEILADLGEHSVLALHYREELERSMWPNG